MTENKDKQLDEQLAQLTRWEGEKTQLWRDALTESEESATSSRFSLKSVLSFRLPAIAAAVIVIAGTAATFQFAFGPESVNSLLDKSSSVSNQRQLGSMQSYATAEMMYDEVPLAQQALGPPELDLNSALNQGGGGGGYGSGGGYGFETVDGVMPGRRQREGTRSIVAQIADGNELQPIDRQVIRKATIELRTDDVRATFLKAAQLISEANSEYTEASSLTGSGDKARANITLRVAVDRLSIVLN